MKKSLLLLILFLCIDNISNAQFLPDFQEIQLSYRNGNLFSAEGIKIDKSSAINYFTDAKVYENFYIKGKRLFTSGIVLSATGAGIVAGSVLFDVIYSSSQKNRPTDDIYIESPYLPIVSLIGSIVGGTLLVASIPLYWVGTVKLKKAATLSFTPPSGGAGLAIRF